MTAHNGYTGRKQSKNKTKTKRSRWTCRWCRKTVFPRSQFKQAHLTEDTHFEVTYCPLCDLVYCRRSCLKQHIQRVHVKKEKTPLRCKFCEKTKNNENFEGLHTFPDAKRFAKHIWTRHACIVGRQFWSTKYEYENISDLWSLIWYWYIYINVQYTYNCYVLLPWCIIIFISSTHIFIYSSPIYILTFG